MSFSCMKFEVISMCSHVNCRDEKASLTNSLLVLKSDFLFSQVELLQRIWFLTYFPEIVEPSTPDLILTLTFLSKISI